MATMLLQIQVDIYRQVKKLVLTKAVCALDREKRSVLPEDAATAIQPTLRHDTEGTDTGDLFAFITDDISLPSSSTENVVDKVDGYLSKLM